MRIEFASAARSDIVEHVCYLTDKRQSLALEFQDAIDVAIQHIASKRFTGTLVVSDHSEIFDVRYYRAPPFRHHLIFYRFDDRGLRILRVRHERSDWANTLDADH